MGDTPRFKIIERRDLRLSDLHSIHIGDWIEGLGTVATVSARDTIRTIASLSDVGNTDATADQAFPMDEEEDLAKIVQRDVELRIQREEQLSGRRPAPSNDRSALLDAYLNTITLAIYLRRLIEGERLDWVRQKNFQLEMGTRKGGKDRD